MERIGVYICECGPNIKEAISIDQVVEGGKNLSQVVFAKPFPVLCSEEGKELMAEDIRRHNLTRVVVAACSPKEHEHTFREVLRLAGLNPFFLQVVNIREQCAWVTPNRRAATEKAKALITAAVNRVAYHEPLASKEIECQADVLVVGAGVAGMSAAITLARPPRRVYVVEKLPCIGGKAARYSYILPDLECASCGLAPLLDKFLHHEQIEIITGGEVTDVVGYFGNFTVRLKQRARFVNPEICLGCGACQGACPVRLANEYNEGRDERAAIYLPYAGAQPHVAVLDRENCWRFQGRQCQACRDICPMGAINFDAVDQIKELKVGAIIIATGFDLFDPRKAPQYGYGQVNNVFSSIEFERLLDPAGPTGGRISLASGQPPAKIALVHCVGSRTAKFNEYCSGICCQYLFKFVDIVNKSLPATTFVAFYTDLCLQGKEAQQFFNRIAHQAGMELCRLQNPGAVEILDHGGKILLRYIKLSGEPTEVLVDLAVLAPAMEGAKDAGRIARIFEISQGAGGFFRESPANLVPVVTNRKGVFIAGCAQAPMDIAHAVTQGQAVAGIILNELIPYEKLALEPVVAEINAELCSGCKICLSLCPARSMSYDEDSEKAVVNAVLCQGCGVCAAACPSGAIKANNFSDGAITAEIGGLLLDDWI